MAIEKPPLERKVDRLREQSRLGDALAIEPVPDEETHF